VPAGAVDRVVIALDPPLADTNLFWGGVGERLPALQALIGNDPETGAYDNSELAESWEANEDFTVWTFRLKPDAEFHFDWGNVTAADVIHSYELTTAEGSTVVGLDRLRGAELDAPDDHTVVFRFAEPRVDFEFLNAGRGALVIYSKAQYEAEGLDGYNERPAGTGPYQLVERRTGEYVLLERVADHWQGIEPDFAELQIRWAAEPATKLALLLAGEAHATDLPREIQGDALAQGRVIIESRISAMQTGAIFNGMYMTTGDPAANPDLPWADIRIREAMNRAIDREAVLDVLYSGRGTPLVRWGMDARHEGYVPELAERFEAMYGYDPERAKELLAEAGYPDAFPDPTIPIVSSVLAGNPEFGAMAELLEVFFSEIGLETEIREMDWATLGSFGRSREAYLINPIRNAPVRPTQAFLETFFTVDGPPFGGWEDDTIEGLIRELRTALDPAERDRIAGAAFTHLFEQYADMPMAEIRADIAADPAVIADWTFPGVTANAVSHWHLIEAAR
jgi:peptide/nickel transport system substrate-binding protein